MKLFKTIPSRTKILDLAWCRREWMVMSQEYRNIRKRYGKPYDSCGWCGYKFADGDSMSIAAPKGGKNILLCEKCVNQIVDGEEA